MSDQVAQRRAETESNPSAPESPIHKAAGQTLRFDRPDESFAEGPPISPSVAEQSRRLSEAGRILAELQQHYDDVARREQSLNQRQAQFEQEQRRLRLQLTETEAELGERKAAQQAQEAALAERMTEFERQGCSFEQAEERLAADQAQLEQDRASLRRELQSELDQDRATLAAERQMLAVHQARVQELGDALLEQHRVQQERVEQQLKLEREAQRASLEQDRAEALKERALHESRIRFQQDHLDKTRAELEADRQQFVGELQQVRRRLEESERQLQSRRRQLDRHRAALQAFAQALDRQGELLARERVAVASTVADEQQNYLADRRAWEADRRQQQAELRRQQETMLTHTENLDTRRVRLESLRREVEETNQATMQLRLAVEDVWAQLQQTLGQASTQERVDAARQEIGFVYEQYQARLAEQRRELNESESTLDQQRMAFLEERRALAEWFTQRDEELSRQEHMQRQKHSEQTTADHQLRRERERWNTEKTEAERIIRQLLEDLVERTTHLPDPDASTVAATAGI